MPGVGRRRYGHSHGAVERYNCVRPIFCAKADQYGQSLLSPRQSPEGPLAANSFRGQPGRFKHANTPNRRAPSTTLSKLGRRMTHNASKQNRRLPIEERAKGEEIRISRSTRDCRHGRDGHTTRCHRTKPDISSSKPAPQPYSLAFPREAREEPALSLPNGWPQAG